MVRMLILGARQHGKRLAVAGVLLAFLALAVLPRRALASSYTDPFWSNNSSAMETACVPCPCGGPTLIEEATSASGASAAVDTHSGELHVTLPLFAMPGMIEDTVFSIRWRSMVSGNSQLGAAVLP